MTIPRWVDPSRVASVEAGPAVPFHLLPHAAIAAVTVLALGAAACGELAEPRLGTSDRADTAGCPAPAPPTLAAQDFRVLFNPNFGASGRREIHVAGPPGTQVTIGSDLASSLPASGFRRFDIDATRIPVPSPGQIEDGKVIPISATAPVQVFANNASPESVDAFAVVPVKLLGTEYYAIGYPNRLAQESQISVHAIEDDTSVTIGDEAPIELDRGQSFLRQQIGDATGIRIRSNKPIGVNSGDRCLSTGGNKCAHVEEMLFPVSSWARSFYIPHLPRLPQRQEYRVIASADGTQVSVDGVLKMTLNAGQYFPGSGGGVHVETSHPAEVYVIVLGEPNGGGDPSFLVVPGAENGVTTATFGALDPGYTNTVVVSMPTASTGTLMLDGAPIAAWTPYPTGGFSSAQITIPADSRSHTLTAADAFIPIVWGARGGDRYGYVGGYADPPIVDPDQIDRDGDGVGDVCDDDDDDDGFPDAYGVTGGGCATGSGATGLGGLLWIAAALIVSRRRRAARLVALCAALAAGAAGTASAQAVREPQDFPAERLRLGADRTAILDVETGAIPAPNSWDLGMWLGVTNDPLTVYMDDGSGAQRVGSLVGNRIGGELMGAYTPLPWLHLGAAVPLILSQSRDNTVAGMVGALPSLQSYGIGDLRLSPKVRLLRGAVDLALIPELTLPTGRGEAYLGERTVSFVPTLAASRRLGRVMLAADLGWRMREQARVANTIIDDELFARVGVGVRATRSVELAGSFGVATAAAAPLGDRRNQVELIGGPSLHLRSGLVLFAAAGVGANVGYTTPDWRGLVGIRLGKVRDAAPTPKPTPAPTPAPIPAPIPAGVVITPTHIQLDEVVYFATDKAVIHVRSYRLLDKVARLIAAHPELLLVQIEGHTDDVADDTYNMDLSQRRADAVRTYLIGKGIEPGRLSAAGFGETQPLMANTSRDYRSANRRVELKIIKRAGAQRTDR